MSAIPDPGGGGLNPSPQVTSVKITESTMTPAKGGDSEDRTKSRPRLRNFAEILNEEMHYRNILEVKLVRLSFLNDQGEHVKAKILSDIDLSEFFFDVLGLKVEDCLGIALRTHRYDTKEIKLKKNVDPSPYINEVPIVFKGHEFTIRKQMNNLTRVTFKNVPFNIPK